MEKEEIKKNNKETRMYFKNLSGRKFRRHISFSFWFLYFISIIILAVIYFLAMNVSCDLKNTDFYTVVYPLIIRIKYFTLLSLHFLIPLTLFDIFFGAVIACAQKDGIFLESEKEVIGVKHITEAVFTEFENVENIYYRSVLPSKYYIPYKENNSFLSITLKDKTNVVIRHATFSLFYFMKKRCKNAKVKSSSDALKSIIILPVLFVIFFIGMMIYKYKN